MKTLTILLTLVTVTSWAQLPMDSETRLFTYQEVIEQPGTKEDLYTRARQWFITNYRSANDVIQLDDKDAGQIVGKGKFSISLSMNTRYVRHTVTIEVKDNKYRYTISNFVLDWGNGIATEPFETVQKMYQSKLYDQTADKMPGIIATLKKQMGTEKTDW